MDSKCKMNLSKIPTLGDIIVDKISKRKTKKFNLAEEIDKITLRNERDQVKAQMEECKTRIDEAKKMLEKTDKIIKQSKSTYVSTTATVGNAPLWIIGPEGELDAIQHTDVGKVSGKSFVIERKHEPKPRRMLRITKGGD